MSNTTINNTAGRVLEAIKARGITRRSSYYFMVRVALLIIGTLFVFLLTIYVASLSIFISVHTGDAPLLPPHDMRDIVESLRALPWMLIVLALLMVGVLEYLSSHFSFIYKRPLVYSAIGGSIAVVLLGILLAQTAVHDRMLELNEHRPLPVMGPMYRYYNVHPGRATTTRPLPPASPQQP